MSRGKEKREDKGREEKSLEWKSKRVNDLHFKGETRQRWIIITDSITVRAVVSDLCLRGRCDDRGVINVAELESGCSLSLLLQSWSEFLDFAGGWQIEINGEMKRRESVLNI